MVQKILKTFPWTYDKQYSSKMTVVLSPTWRGNEGGRWRIELNENENALSRIFPESIGAKTKTLTGFNPIQPKTLTNCGQFVFGDLWVEMN